MRRRWAPVATYYGLPVAPEPTAESRLAAALVADALRRARAGDQAERLWLATPKKLDPWARCLGVDGDRLADLAGAALRGDGREAAEE